MDIYEECLNDLDRSIPEYIRKVGSFQFQDKEYELVKAYESPEYDRCQVCGHFPITEVYVVSDGEKELKVGNICIDKISDQKIKQWFKGYCRKRNNIVKNEFMIHNISKLLELSKGRKPKIWISKQGRDKLQKMLSRMYKGINPIKSQIKLFEYYMDKYFGVL